MSSYIEYRKPVPFGRYKDVFTEENILREKLIEKAKALHNYYESIYNTGKKWEDLSGFLRGSNISAADFGNILADLNKDEMELAELEHIRWCRFNFLNYYKYGEVRNDVERIHNDLVQFDELSLEEQKKNIEAVRIVKELVKEN
ncbi:MAG: RyR domain-containing protein [Catonella sp.]|uniref:RyR domain-containing protein n=1 Tax=Catonella sp. TaxID=2382125 RepID=UPI003F9F7CF9